MLQTSKSDFIEVTVDDAAVRAVAQNGVTITIDRSKCTYSMYDPKGCKRCLQGCPVKVFATRPLEKRDFSVPVKQRVDPTVWILIPTWADWCNGCGLCVAECPTGALTIYLGSRPVTG